MSSKKNVIKNAIVYSFSNILLRAFNFFLLPLYTAYLSTEDYGTTNLVKNFTGVVSIICVFSTYAAVARFYTDCREDKEKSARLFGTLISFTILSSTFFFVLLCVLQDVLERHIFKGVPFLPTVLTAIIGIGFGCLYTMYQYILKGTERAKHSALTSIMYFFIMLAFNMIFVVGFKMGAYGVVLSTLITNIIGTIYMFASMIKNKEIKIGIDFKILREVLLYSVPLMPHDLSTTISSFVSSVFINNSYSLSSLGLYSMACQFGDIADTIQSSVNTAFQPWFYSQMKEARPQCGTEIRRLSYTLVWLYSTVFLGIALFAQDVILLFLNERYKLAWKLIPLIVISYTIKTVYYFYVNVLFFHKSSSKYIFISTLASSLLNVVFSAILIPRYGSYGSVWADIIAMLIRVFIIVKISKKIDDIGYRVLEFIKITLLEVVFISLGLIFSYTKYQETFSISNFLYKIIVYGIFCFIVFWTQKNNLKSLAIFKKRGGSE